jgi:hypothetical protein
MRVKIFIIVLTTIWLASACNKKDNFNYPEGTVGISKITNFPVLTLKGSDVEVVEKGKPFNDPGATATEGGNPLTVTTTGSVDINTPGVYTLTYSAVNKDGFSASTRRTVVVYSTDASAAAHDLSGTYLRSSTGASAVWTKIAPGVYSVFNPGGAVGVNLTVILVNPTGFEISIPEQISSDGNVSSSSNESYTEGPPAKVSYVFHNPGYGTAQRNFVKQ